MQGARIKGSKKSSIRRHLNEKIEEWIASVKDKDVQKVIREETIVTGGSIASMLLGEKINDYESTFGQIIFVVVMVLGVIIVTESVLS